MPGRVDAALVPRPNLLPSKFKHLISWFRKGELPPLSDAPIGLRKPIPIEQRLRPIERSSLQPNLLALPAESLSLGGSQLHLAAIAQIMSVRPQTKENVWVDWYHVATNFIRVSPPPGRNPLSFLWSPSVWSLAVVSEVTIDSVLAHARSCRFKGTIVTINPSKTTIKKCQSISSVSLAFQENDPVFVNYPTKLAIAFFCDGFKASSKRSQSHRGISICIHPEWERLVTYPKSRFNISGFMDRMAAHPSNEAIWDCMF
jgi:hypothetical protein